MIARSSIKKHVYTCFKCDGFWSPLAPLMRFRGGLSFPYGQGSIAHPKLMHKQIIARLDHHDVSLVANCHSQPSIQLDASSPEQITYLNAQIMTSKSDFHHRGIGSPSSLRPLPLFSCSRGCARDLDPILADGLRVVTTGTGIVIFVHIDRNTLTTKFVWRYFH